MLNREKRKPRPTECKCEKLIGYFFPVLTPVVECLNCHAFMCETWELEAAGVQLERGSSYNLDGTTAYLTAKRNLEKAQREKEIKEFIESDFGRWVKIEFLKVIDQMNLLQERIERRLKGK